MPRLIFKCPYLPPGGGNDRGGYAAYIATRDGVEIIPGEKRMTPATANQDQLIQKLLRDFPDAADSFEYDDYIANPTAGNASEFITRTLESNYMNAKGREGYVEYISERPRVAKVGEHGLFGSEGGPLVLSRVSEEIRTHPGNVWTPIFSLRREDAVRLGYDNAANWLALLRTHPRILPEEYPATQIHEPTCLERGSDARRCAKTTCGSRSIIQILRSRRKRRPKNKGVSATHPPGRQPMAGCFAKKASGTMLLPSSHSHKQWGRSPEILAGVRFP